jgi:hypothetical protein
MGGERASTARMRLSGRICCFCKVPLAPHPTQAGERLCDRCAETRQPTSRRIYLSFIHGNGWRCQFWEDDLKTPLPRKLRFVDSAKIVELAERTGSLRNLETRQALEHGISKGRGGLFLTVTAEQYEKLK